MTNNSATGGYLLPTDTPLPGGLSFEDFIQTVLSGITGIDGTLTRPLWQAEPPPQPDIAVNWLAFGTTDIKAKGYPYVIQLGDGGSALKNFTETEIECRFYGPQALQNAAHLRDGFNITQNLEALYLADIAFKECSEIKRAPELINERWFDRADITVTVNREVDRTYEVLYFLRAQGTIITDDDPQLSASWNTANEQ